jgi:L-threonylcarbamoyladenylate synthase
MKTHHLESAEISAAARLLEAGKLVAFPTETVYGLGADAENPAAVARIYAAKGRPSNHPVIVHIVSQVEATRWAAELPEEAHRLMAAFWPGPLTLIVKRAASISAAVSGGQNTIGLRCPSHPVAQALMREFKKGKGGIAAPSANKFGHVSPTSAQHVRDEFGAEGCGPVACVLDGGRSAVGIESTIVDVSRMASLGPVLLRPGSISVDAIAAIIGLRPGLPDQGAPRVSGSLQSHYAPRSPVALVASADCADTLHALRARGRSVAIISHSAAHLDLNSVQAAVAVSLPGEPAGYAHGLYAALRELDAFGADIILVEAPPRDAAWSGVWDRLQRAAHDSTGTLQSLLA